MPEAKNDLCMAAAAWTAVTGVPIDFVDECPSGLTCHKVTSVPVNINSQQFDALAAGLSSAEAVSCSGTNDEPRMTAAELRFNSFSSPRWRPNAFRLAGRPEVIYDIALHELGHILQQNHVDNNSELMRRIRMTIGGYLSDPLTPAAKAGGVHVGNVSRGLPCNNVPVSKFQNENCFGTSGNTTPQEDGQAINIFFDIISSNLIVELSDSEISNHFKIEIYDCLGRTVILRDGSGYRSEIDLSELPYGYFVVELRNHNIQVRKPISK